VRISGTEAGIFVRVGLASFVGLLVCVLEAAAADTDQNQPRVEEIIVTGISEKPLADLPRSASVITASDIALSPSVNVVDLLAREANLVLRSTVGNEKFSGVDIRGQGDTYSNNVLLLVDGFTVNEADLSGADYSLVALDQIERIEVIRGANAVRYGNGAVGGVINIIMRTPEQGLGLNARTRYGSYETTDRGLGISWADELFEFGVDGAYYDSDGYRDNGDLEKKDLLARAGIKPTDWLEAELSGRWHRDEYGLPGPISEEAFEGNKSDRESTDFPFDRGETDDDTVRADLQLGNDVIGQLRLSGLHRERENDFRLGAASDSDPFQTITEDSDDLFAQYDYGFSWLGREHALYAGYENSDTDYARAGPPEVLNSESKQGDIRQEAWFIAADAGLSDSLTASVGYRQDRYRLDSLDRTYTDSLCDDLLAIGTPPNQVFICNDPDGFRSGYRIDRDERNAWRSSSTEAGLVYSPTDKTRWFIAYAQSFRNPNVDELIFAAEGLGPQTSDHWDAGVRHLFGQVLELSLALFYSETDDEILFGVDTTDNTAINRNADETIERLGGEVELRWYVTDELRLTSNAGYTRARFEDSNNSLPLVPEWTAAITAQWQPAQGWTLNVSGNYVDDRYDGNDFTNDVYPQVDSYIVFDTRLSWESDGLQLYAGIGNLLDEVYATSVYSNRYYPMQDRNYYAGIAYRM
jgi:outer membrane receptor protein involved in Fe transport